MRLLIALVVPLGGWLVTGPVGHLVAGVADWAVVLGRIAAARARGRAVEW